MQLGISVTANKVTLNNNKTEVVVAFKSLLSSSSTTNITCLGFVVRYSTRGSCRTQLPRFSRVWKILWPPSRATYCIRKRKILWLEVHAPARERSTDRKGLYAASHKPRYSLLSSSYGYLRPAVYVYLSIHRICIHSGVLGVVHAGYESSFKQTWVLDLSSLRYNQVHDTFQLHQALATHYRCHPPPLAPSPALLPSLTLPQYLADLLHQHTSSLDRCLSDVGLLSILWFKGRISSGVAPSHQQQQQPLRRNSSGLSGCCVRPLLSPPQSITLWLWTVLYDHTSKLTFLPGFPYKICLSTFMLWWFVKWPLVL